MTDTLAVTRLAPFAMWQQAYFTPEQLADPSISGETADPDMDGICNLMEWASNSDPSTPSLENAPTVTFDSPYLSLTYTRLLGETDLLYSIEQSIDLTTWSLAAPINQVLADDGITQRIKAQVPIGNADRFFLRLRVSQ